jgi:hypothetical protein
VLAYVPLALFGERDRPARAFIPHSRNPPSKAEQAGDWLETARNIVAGLFGRR